MSRFSRAIRVSAPSSLRLDDEGDEDRDVENVDVLGEGGRSKVVDSGGLTGRL